MTTMLQHAFSSPRISGALARFLKPLPLAALLAALLAPPAAQAQAADLYVYGGGGGGGGTDSGGPYGGNGGDGGALAGNGGRGYRWDGRANFGGGGGGGGAYVGEGSGKGEDGTDADSASPGTRGAGVCDLPVGTCNGANAGADGSRDGGAGGSAKWQVTGSRHWVSVIGGNGGNGGGGGPGSLDKGFAGGAGGGASLVLWNDFSTARLFIWGSNGGDGGNADGGDGGAGGAGGAAWLDGGTFALTVDLLSVSSGKAGKAGADRLGDEGAAGGTGGAGGAGGAATLEAGTLKAGNIFLTKQDGDLSVKVGTLDVTDRDTALTLKDTAAGEVSFTQAALGGGYTLTAKGNGAASVGTLRLTGTGGLSIDESVLNITTLELGSQHTLKGTGDGKAKIDTLRLTGAGSIYADGDTDPYSYGRFQVGRLASDGGVLTDASGVFNWYSFAINRTYTNRDIEIQGGGLTIDLSASNTNNQNLNRKLTGTGGLTKQGTNTLTLSGANSYTGGTQVAAGTLRLTNVAASGTGDVALAGGTTLILEAAGSYTNKITGTGKVEAAPGAGGTLTLSNASSSYTGGTQVKNGTLELKHAKAAGTNTVQVADGATLRLAASGGWYPQMKGSAGSTLAVAATGIYVGGGASGFGRYVFDASVLGAGATALSLGQDALTVDASQVALDNTNSGLNLLFGQSVTLIRLDSGLYPSSDTLTLNGSGALHTNRLDNEATGLIERAWNLTQAQANTLDLAFNELYLYGNPKNGAPPITPGQRETGNGLTLADTDRASAAFAGRASTGNVTGNTLTIDSPATLLTDATNPLSGKAYGGYADAGDATNNTVILSAGMQGKTADFGIVGGASGSGGSVSGNTLMVEAGEVTVKSVGGFDEYVFATSALSATTPALTLAAQPAALDIEAAKVRLDDTGALPPLKVGESVTLISNATGVTLTGAATINIQGMMLELGSDGKKLFATVKAPPPSGATAVPTLGELGLLLSSLALAGAGAGALRRRKNMGKSMEKAPL